MSGFTEGIFRCPAVTCPTGRRGPVRLASGGGNVHMLMRSSERFLFRSDSTYYTEISNNNSGIALVQAPDRRLSPASNPIGCSWRHRYPLTVLLFLYNGWLAEEMCLGKKARASSPTRVLCLAAAVC